VFQSSKRNTKVWASNLPVDTISKRPPNAVAFLF